MSTLSHNRGCPSTIESWPTAGQPRHHSEVWSQTRIGIKIRLIVLTTSLWCPALNKSTDPPQKPNIWWISTARRNEDDLRRSTSSNPQENYQNTTASSLFCKTANDQVISQSDAASVTNGWQHPTASKRYSGSTLNQTNPNFQKSLKMISNFTLTKQITNDHFGHFSKFYLKNMSSLFHIFCHMD